jgi:hypothetical protein
LEIESSKMNISVLYSSEILLEYASLNFDLNVSFDIKRSIGTNSFSGTFRIDGLSREIDTKFTEDIASISDKSILILPILYCSFY